MVWAIPDNFLKQSLILWAKKIYEIDPNLQTICITCFGRSIASTMSLKGYAILVITSGPMNVRGTTPG